MSEARSQLRAYGHDVTMAARETCIVSDWIN